MLENEHIKWEHTEIQNFWASQILAKTHVAALICDY